METMMMAAPTQEQMYANPPGTFSVSVVGNPFTWQNTTGHVCLIVINGGVVNALSMSNDNVTFDVVGLLSGCYAVPINGFFKIAYTVTPPTVKVYPL